MLPGLCGPVLAGGDEYIRGHQLPGGMWLDGVSDYLSWDQPGAGNRSTWTLEIILRRLVVGDGTNHVIFARHNTAVLFDSTNDALSIYYNGTTRFTTNAQFTDPNSSYQIVIAHNADETGDDKLKVWVNGLQQTDLSADSRSAMSATGDINDGGEHRIGRGVDGITQYGKFLFSRIAFTDSTAYAATDFGEADSNGVWRPKNIFGLSFGNNGFHLDFADSADLGKDVSGNNNDWTLNSITSANATKDTASDPSPVLNLLAARHSTQTISEGGSRIAMSGNGGTPLSVGVKTGLWYMEVNINSIVGAYIGLTREDNYGTGYTSGAETFALNASGDIYKNSSPQTQNSTTFTTSDTLMLAIDMDKHMMWWGKNGTWYSADDSSTNTITQADVEAGLYGYDFSSLDEGNTWLVWLASSGGANNMSIVTHEDDFAHTVPTGFAALRPKNLTEPAIKKGSDHFKTRLYTGNGSTLERDIEDIGFQPDLAWFKDRGNAAYHVVIDSLRSGFGSIFPNNNADEIDEGEFVSFNPDGITIRKNVPYDRLNGSNRSMVAWLWKAGGTGVANHDGSIESMVSANVEAGMAIVKYTGDGNTSSMVTVGHGLSEKPELIITRKISGAGTDYGWASWHKHVGIGYNMLLHTSAARNPGGWNGDTGHSAAVFVPADKNYNNVSGAQYINYLFHSIEGFSKIGSYTGNGSADGPFIWCGFKSAYVMVKRSDSTGNWLMYDTERGAFNLIDEYLYANAVGAEGISASSGVDFLSNGIKVRTTSSDANTNGGKYIFMAFAEHPFGGENTTPILAG